MLEKRVAAIGKLCFGLAGMLAGDATGAMSVAEAAAGAVDRARAAGQQPEAVIIRVLDGHRRTWGAEYAGPADRAAIEAVEAQLADSLTVVLDPDALTTAAFDPRGLQRRRRRLRSRRWGSTTRGGIRRWRAATPTACSWPG